MKTRLLFIFFLLMTGKSLLAQTSTRLNIISILPNVYTGQDYSPWLTDDTAVNITDVNTPDNDFYTDITLQLDKKSNLNTILLYSGNGTFSSGVTSVYAVAESGWTYIGDFNGSAYGAWDTLSISPAVAADAIVIRKYKNSLPQKIKVYGTPVAPALQRIHYSAPVPSEETGQDYTPWLSDRVDSVVDYAWQNNFVWVDVKLPLTQKSSISKISYYDWQGVFDPKAYIYAKNGSQV